MLKLSDPLFWMIVVGMTLPWGAVVWLGFSLARAKWARDYWREKFNQIIHQQESERALFGDRTDRPSNVIPLAQMGGKHRGAVVDVPFKGKVS